MASTVYPPANGLVITDATNIAFSTPITSPSHHRSNTMVGTHGIKPCSVKATLQDVLMHNASASVALQTLATPGSVIG